MRRAGARKICLIINNAASSRKILYKFRALVHCRFPHSTEWLQSTSGQSQFVGKANEASWSAGAYYLRVIEERLTVVDAAADTMRQRPLSVEQYLVPRPLST